MVSSRFGGSAGRGLIWRSARVGIIAKVRYYVIRYFYVTLDDGQVVSLVSERYILLVYAVLKGFEGQIGNGNYGSNVTQSA